ncbi:TolB family protein [Streptomyces sp. NPDC058676]|uniref:TolB family protein n=1 Tax=unclassified Streptomyces TaxID=2593676 RepID=UPI003657C172
MRTKRHRAALAATVVAATAAMTLTGSAVSAAPSAAPSAPHTEPVSVTPDNKAGNGASSGAVTSRDGRYVAFSSSASDLLPGAPEGGVFVRDLRTGKLRHVAVGGSPSLSADGRHLAYTTGTEVRLRDLRTGRTERLDTGIPASYGTGRADVALSGNARYAVFTAGGQYDGEEGGSVVFLHDRVTGTTERVSHPKPTWEPRNAGAPTVSDDGSRVVYDYRYANGPRGDDWGDVWMLDRGTGARTQIDRSHDGSQTQRESLLPSISGDGRTVVFESADTNLVPDDTDGSWNVFVHDVASGANQRVHATHGGPATAYTRAPAVSSDGRYVTFSSRVDEPGSRWGTENPVYLRDLKTGETVLVTPDTTGGTATAEVAPGGIANGARRIAFTSPDATLIEGGDVNDGYDVLVRHLR